jgi:hypothetical protein
MPHPPHGAARPSKLSKRHTFAGWATRALVIFFWTFFTALCTQAQVALLLEEPYGRLGSMNPTGHAVVYLSRVCADSPLQLRRCAPGEMGVVIGRYHYIGGYDWLAIPLIPYLYAVDSLADVPAQASMPIEATLRDRWRRRNLEALAPDVPVPVVEPPSSRTATPASEGEAARFVEPSMAGTKPVEYKSGVAESAGAVPPGEWYMLVGAAYDRKIYGFELDSTPAQDDAFIAAWNGHTNHSHFNLLFRNCADFARAVLDFYYPHAVHRNWVADIGMTTPKQVAKSIQRYGRRHPELHMTTFIVPQVPGTIRRSHHADGIAEAVVKSKKYVVPLAFVSPIAVGSLVAAWAIEGRFRPPREAPPMAELSTPGERLRKAAPGTGSSSHGTDAAAASGLNATLLSVHAALGMAAAQQHQGKPAGGQVE